MDLQTRQKLSRKTYQDWIFGVLLEYLMSQKNFSVEVKVSLKVLSTKDVNRAEGIMTLKMLDNFRKRYKHSRNAKNLDKC